MQSLWKIISVFLLSSFTLVKGGVPLAVSFGFRFFESVVITTFGGIMGAIFYVFIWDKVITTIKKRKSEKQKNNNSVKPKKKFTIQNKILIIVKKRFGLPGIAFITPLFSYPLGCYVAVRYYQREKQKILVYMFSSSLIWSVILFSIKLFF